MKNLFHSTAKSSTLKLNSTTCIMKVVTMDKKPYFNVMEEIVPTIVNVLLNSPDYQTVCRCEKCTTDIIALSLNSIPARYVTTDEKRNLVYELFGKSSMRDMLNKHIIGAIHVVRKNPNHD